MPHETGIIHESSATGAEIQSLVSEIEPILINYPRHHVIIACLSLAVLVMHPDLSPRQLQEGVRGASQWIALFLSTTNETDTDEMPKELLN